MIETIISIQKHDIYNIYIYINIFINLKSKSCLFTIGYRICEGLSTKEVKYQKYYNIQRGISQNYTIVLLSY